MRAKLKRLAWVVCAPALRLLFRVCENDDPWERVDHRISVRMFGLGSRREFTWYFEGESQVEVRSVEEVCVWLAECEYMEDQDLFNEVDFWQHPRTFEHLRKGDCEDYSLQAWRKLAELGFEVEFVAGEVIKGKNVGGHCWVHVRHDGEELLLESTAKAPERMLRPVADMRDRYRPHFAVDQSLRSYAYVGYFHRLNEKLERDAQRRRERLRAWLGGPGSERQVDRAAASTPKMRIGKAASGSDGA